MHASSSTTAAERKQNIKFIDFLSQMRAFFCRTEKFTMHCRASCAPLVKWWVPIYKNEFCLLTEHENKTTQRAELAICVAV